MHFEAGELLANSKANITERRVVQNIYIKMKNVANEYY